MQRLQNLQQQVNFLGDDDTFGHIQLAPADPILGMSLAYKADTTPGKIDLGVGAYRTDDEKPHVFDIVRKLEAEVISDKSLNKEYLPIEGLADFNKGAAALLFGKNSPAITESRIVSAQCLGGTGALRIGFDFIKRFIPGDIYVSRPTWGNHNQIISQVGLNQIEYPYFDVKTRGFDLKGALDTLSKARPGSVVLLHVCAHNPTGVDPTEQEWLQIADVCKRRRLVPFFDCAYQGFATGDLDRDAFSVRKFIELGFQMIVSQSFSKNMGLYNERVGAVHFITGNKETAVRLLSQLKTVIRVAVSNPPAHGARVAAKILTNEQNYTLWVNELKTVTGRIISMRQLLKQELDALKVPGNWDHVTVQTGFFTFTGLTPEQCERMISKHHVYMLKNGRISMAGITTKNVKQLALAIQDVVVNK
ncbi:hypothetical protein pb186bvf_008497 [Paramecium bursaria]